MTDEILCEECGKPITGKDYAGLDLEGILTGARARHYRCLDLPEKIELEKKTLLAALSEVQEHVEKGAAARRRVAAHRKRLASLRKQEAQLDKLPKPTNGHRPKEEDAD